MGFRKSRSYEKYSEPKPAARCRPAVKPEVTIAALLKPFTCDSLIYECRIIKLNEGNYKEILQEKSINMLLADRILSGDGELDSTMFNILGLCKKKGIPTVFWDTYEDETLLDNLELIKHFDIVFTVKPRKVSDYKRALKKEKVFFLPFAVQPRIYNPIEKDLKNKEYEISQNEHVGFQRAGAHSSLISVRLKKDELKELTFLPKEVFELAALGTPVISPYSKDIEDLLPQIVRFYQSEEEYAGILKSFQHDKDAVDKLSLLGQRHILDSCTYTNRIDTIMKIAGLADKPTQLPGVTMVSATNKLDAMDNILKNYENQRYENKELIIVLNNNKLDLGEWKSRASEYKKVRVFQLDDSQPLGRCLNLALFNSDFPYISKCDDDNYYGPNFISDLMNAYKYADSEIVGKLSYYCYLEGCRILAMMCPQMEYRYVNMLSGSALIIAREVFDKVKFSDKRAGSDTVFLKECIKQGVRMFSADRFNYVYNRHASMQVHTWKMPDEVFLRSCKVIDITDDYIPRVTV